MAIILMPLGFTNVCVSLSVCLIVLVNCSVEEMPSGDLPSRSSLRNRNDVRNMQIIMSRPKVTDRMFLKSTATMTLDA